MWYLEEWAYVSVYLKKVIKCPKLLILGRMSWVPRSLTQGWPMPLVQRVEPVALQSLRATPCWNSRWLQTDRAFAFQALTWYIRFAMSSGIILEILFWGFFKLFWSYIEITCYICLQTGNFLLLRNTIFNCCLALDIDWEAVLCVCGRWFSCFWF